MSVSHKSQSTQMFRLMLYSRPLHPELFDLQARRMDHHGEYEIETWLIPGGHVVRFQIPDQHLTETVIDRGDHLPENGLVHALPCMGEKDYEMEQQDRLVYVTTVQSESLTENLYNATLKEMTDFAEETGSVSFDWKDAQGTECLSLVDSQKYRSEYHVQSYHLLGSTGVVLRTQSIFEIRD
ncbi:hypothetical protein Pan265_09970 [Mucisphaera calidilacus]|uniref:DUF2617 domain-containing protein n=2 Tax=Mucisphaera calidilacus TaxID=2527982 RepID=A0A518BVZ9_9BACT|nr:hypothetical protein Pan265_09970 [Mucisphaera calidilacus]